MEPLVSIIIPVYNVESYLPACLDSVLRQSYGDLEILLIDDGATDRCPVICEEYAGRDNRIKVIHQKNTGLSGARNTGLDHCTGEYIAFVDSDDFIHPQYVEKLLQACTETGCDIALGFFARVGADADPGKPAYRKPLSKSGYDTVTGREANLRLYTDRYWSQTTVAWNKLYRRRLWDTARFPGVIHEDEALVYRILYQTDWITYVQEDLYFYRSNDKGLMATRFTAKSPDKLTMLEIMDNRLAFYREKGESRLEVLTENREFFMAVEYLQIVSDWPVADKALLRRYRRKMRELYVPLLRSDYPVKRKLFYTMALLAPKHFKRLYCMRE